MMSGKPPKKVRPWLKRLSYVLAGGVVVGAGGVWFAYSPAMQRVYIRAIASAIKNAADLDFDAEGLGFSVFTGRVSLYRPSLGIGLFKADEITLSADIRSLLGSAPHLRSLTIVNPVSNISAARLNQIKLKQSDGPAANWILDALEIRNGSLIIEEPEWGLPSAVVAFSASATGSGPRKLQLGVECSRIALANESGILQGSANFRVDMDADAYALRQLNFDSESLKFKADGAFDAVNGVIQCGANGSVFSQNLGEIFGDSFPRLNGRVDFQASVTGRASSPEWTFRASGEGLQTPYEPLNNCSFVVEANGGASVIDIRQIRAWSGKSHLTARGALSNTDCKLVLDGRALSLKPLSDMLKTTALAPVDADIRGTFSSPAPIWSVDALNRFNMGLSADFSVNGNAVGNLAVSVAENSVKIDSFKLDAPDLKVSVNGDAEFKIDVAALSPLRGPDAHAPISAQPGNSAAGAFALTSIDLTADVFTTAELTAYSLDKWNVIDRLPISGDTHATAKITWSPSRDLRLNGSVKVEGPVYFGATADTLATDVRIESKQLFLDNIRLKRKEAEAAGHLWLTWANVPEGAEQISMRYESFGLPLSEGLETGISNLEILEAMAAKGIVNGWVTLRGPYGAMVLEGEASLYNGSIYGVSIPAFFASIEMDLEKQNRQLAVPEFRLADSRENLDSFRGSLGLKGSLDIDLTSETWSGKVSGLADSHALGLLNAPRFSAQAAISFDGFYATDFGLISLPEGTVNLSDGRIFLDGNEKIRGLSGNISVGNDRIQGSVRFQDFQDSERQLIQFNAQKTANALQGRMNVFLSPETADTKGLAKFFTNGAFEDLQFGLAATGRLTDRGLTWRADMDTFSGRVFGLELSQQSLGSIEGNSERIKLAFDLGSRNLGGGPDEPLSRLRVEGTLPLGGMRTADFTLMGTADLEQTRNLLAGVFGQSPDAFLAGFTPSGAGLMDLRLHGPYDALGLDGALQIRGGRLHPGGDFPYGIDNLNLDLICENRRISLKNMDGRMARGRLRANGDAIWNNSGVESYQLNTKLDDFHYRYQPEGFHLGGSVDALFHSIPGGKAEIRGTLKATNMVYTDDINLAKIIFNNAAGSIPSIQNIDFDDPLDAINLNLDVELTQPWTFDTNLIKIKGTPTERFKILGTLANPGLRGRMEFVSGGRITDILPAGDIIVEKGSIDFPDPNLFNPVINIQGQIDISPFRVNINIQGPLDTLDIVPTSTPSLRQDEVISLLLNPAIASSLGNSAFNSSLSSTASMSGLTGSASGLVFGLLTNQLTERFRRVLMLDRVSVAWRTSTTGAYEADVIVGKNINLASRTIPVTGSYTTNGDIATIGGQMEWRFGNLVIHLGASGSRGLGATPSGEIRYSWSSW